MALTIMNLLVGLTANKIEELIKTGEKTQAMKRVEDISGIAKMISRVRKCFKLQGVMKEFDKDNQTKVSHHSFLKLDFKIDYLYLQGRKCFPKTGWASSNAAHCYHHCYWPLPYSILPKPGWVIAQPANPSFTPLINVGKL